MVRLLQVAPVYDRLVAAYGPGAYVTPPGLEPWSAADGSPLADQRSSPRGRDDAYLSEEDGEPAVEVIRCAEDGTPIVFGKAEAYRNLLTEKCWCGQVGAFCCMHARLEQEVVDP